MLLTDYHAKYFAHELTKRCSSDSTEKLAGALVDAQVDLNPQAARRNRSRNRMASLTDSAPLRRTILVFSGSVFALYAFPYAMLEESPHRMVWRAMRLVAAFGAPIGFWILQGLTESGSVPAFARSRARPRELPELLRVPPPPEDALESRRTDPFLLS